MEEQLFAQRTDLSALNQAVMSIRNEIKKVIVGQDEMVKLIIAALLADGHVLIEGVPGVAKTLTAKLVARSLAVHFSRIQFTPDLMPSDVLGTPVFNPKEASFDFKKGTLFSNIRKVVKTLVIEEKLLQFIAKLTHQTRNHKSIYLGASPRASLAIMNASKAVAAISGRDFVTPEDILEVVPPVLRHRIILSPEKEMEGVTEDSVIRQILQTLDIPR